MALEDLKLKLTALFEPAPEGGYTRHFEELPEIFSEGETLEEAKANLLDALEQVMEYHREESRRNSRPDALREELRLAASRSGFRSNSISVRGCVLAREGRNHAIWKNPAKGKIAPMPRHRDVKEGHSPLGLATTGTPEAITTRLIPLAVLAVFAFKTRTRVKVRSRPGASDTRKSTGLWNGRLPKRD